MKISNATKIKEGYNDPKLQDSVIKNHSVDDDVNYWLGKLSLLDDVPVNYLIPDEAMLPPESIRFFYLDPNWIEALLDGAVSVGFNSYIPPNQTLQESLFARAKPALRRNTYSSASSIRAKYLGTKGMLNLTIDTVITGFLLRSSMVQNSPGVEIVPYVKSSGGKKEAEIIKMMALGDCSDTLICLVNGDICGISVFEAPESLHYGVQRQGENFIKRAHKFKFDTKTKRVELLTGDNDIVDVDINNCFRAGGKRVINMSNLASSLGDKLKDSGSALDAAEMGFEMIEGVCKVDFYRR